MTVNTYFNQQVPLAPAPNQPQVGMVRNVIAKTTQVLGKVAEGVSYTLSSAVNPIGGGLVTGAMNSAKKEIEQLTQPDGPISIQAKQIFKEVLIGKSPQELLSPQEFLQLNQLNQFLKRMIDQPQTATLDEIKQAHTCLQMLTNNDNQSLKQLTSKLSQDELQLFSTVTEGLSCFAESEKTKEEIEKEFRDAISCTEGQEQLRNFVLVFDSVLNENRGVFALLEENILKMTERFCKRVEEIPQNMVKNVMAVVCSPSDAPSQPEKATTVSQFLFYGASILKKNILDKEGNLAISQQTLTFISNTALIALRQALKKMGTTEAFQAQRDALTEIITHLEHPQPLPEVLTPDELKAARENDPDAFDDNGHPLSPWHTLYNRMISAAKILDSAKIYIDGFRMPHLDQSKGELNAEAAFMNNTAALKEAITPLLSPAPKENCDWKTLATEEKDKLTENTTQFLALQYIYEKVCGLTPSDNQFYVRLMDRAKTSGDSLEQILFDDLKQKNISYLKCLWAKFIYRVGFGHFVKKYIARANAFYFDKIFKYIESHKSRNFDELSNQITQNFSRYLATLGGAYNAIAKSSESGILNEMLKEQLEKSDSNLKLETKELYLSFANEIIEKSAGSRFMAWFAKKLMGDSEKIVRSIIDTTMGALQDTHGYTHALNSFLCEQLEEVYNMLQHRQANPRNPLTDSNLSANKKDELIVLTKNLIEVLGKSKCQTPDELRDFLASQKSSNNALSDLLSGKLKANFNKALDDLYIDDVTEKAANILAITIQSFAEENQLLKLTYRFANIANQAFDLKTPPTIAEMKDKENKVAELCEKIVKIAVETAVEEKFDLNGKQQQESNRHIQKIQQYSTEFFETFQEHLNELAAQKDFSSPECKNKITALIKDTIAYEEKCAEANLQVKHSEMNSDNKNEIGQQYLGIAEQSQPLVQTVILIMKKHSEILQNLNANIPHEASDEIQGLISLAQRNLQALQDWENNNIKEIPYVNFSLLDGVKKPLQDWATGLIYGRVKEHADGLMRLLRKKETYPAALNHLFFIPYVKAMHEGS